MTKNRHQHLIVHQQIPSLTSVANIDLDLLCVRRRLHVVLVVFSIVLDLEFRDSIQNPFSYSDSLQTSKRFKNLTFLGCMFAESGQIALRHQGDY